MYVAVQNELARAFNEIRDQVATQKFGKKFLDLEAAERKVIAKAVEQKISESEPINTTGGK
jgi:hypothetical protein